MRLLLLMCAAIPLSAQNLMPWPAQLTPGTGKLTIDSSFRVTLTAHRDGQLEAAAGRLVARLSRQTGIPFRETGTEATLAIRCVGPGAMPPSWKDDESYRLEVTPQQARLDAATVTGALRGMETFLQLVEPDGDGFSAPALRIDDKPRFPWRGLLIDVARHWMPAEVVKRNLDAMAAVKLNVLHWHLSDDQGFRIESKAFPDLQGKGSDGHYYTQAEIRDIIAYAAERGIRVVPEFDMPGHTTAWFVGYPELASAPGPYQIERAWGVFNPCMDPTREEVYKFLDAFIDEMAGLFPDDYFHIGGDENNGKAWDANPAIQEFKRAHGFKSNHDLQAYFNQRIEKSVTGHGKKMVGWDEVLHPELPKDIVVQSWRGQKSLGEAARQGYQGILSWGYYLDHMQPASYHYAVDPLGKEAANLPADAKARVLGGEACMWAEYVTPETVDSRIWPRTAAIAERLWSPAEVTDVASMYRRMAVVSRKLDWVGVRHRLNYEPMLERLSDYRETAQLKTLADVVEPVRLYERGRGRKYTQFTPLNRLVDAARPESAVARAFSNAVDAFLKDRQARRDEVRQFLQSWAGNHARLAPVLEASFLLKEASPVSEDVSALGRAGLEAVDLLTKGQRPPQSWADQQKQLLDRARQHRAELLIAILAPVSRLVEAAK